MLRRLFVPLLLMLSTSYRLPRLCIRRRIVALHTYSSNFPLEVEESEIIGLFRAFSTQNKNLVTIRIAGGWVRDKLLGVQTKPDIDIAVDTMSGVQFAKLFAAWSLERNGREIHMGIIQSNPDKSKHLETASFSLGKYSIDIVNLRTENYTSDSRIPVIDIGTPREDAFRRDLTINSLFYNINNDQIEDFTELGMQDLQDRLIRTPLQALITLEDDPLRALRAIRFTCRFNFTLHPDLLHACSQPSVHSLVHAKVSKERVAIELNYMLAHPSYERALHLLFTTRLLHQLFTLPPTITPADKIVPAHIPHHVLSTENALEDTSLRMATLLIGQGVHSVTLYNQLLSRLPQYPAMALDTRERRLTVLLNFGQTLKCPPLKNKKKMIPLTEYLLQDLRMSSKDISFVMEAQECCSEYTKFLSTCLAVHRGEASENIETQPMTGYIGREQLGALLMRSKEQYPFHLLFAVMNVVLSQGSAEEALLLQIVEDVVKAIDDLELEGVWLKAPLLDGEVIKEHFKRIPPGPSFKAITKAQEAWMLRNPEGTNALCLRYLQETFPDFV